jgi:hypothetical protein
MLAVGHGNILPLSGHLRLPASAGRSKMWARPRALRLLLDGRPVPAWIDMHPDPFEAGDRHLFWSWAEFAPVVVPQTVELEIELTCVDGSVHAARLGSIELLPGARAPLVLPAPPLGPRIVICMATYQPKAELLERQIRSLLDQTIEGWTCIVSDDRSSGPAWESVRALAETDARIVLAPRAPGRLGVYRNFERALSLTPHWAQHVGYSDQDDVWHPNKLERLLDDLERPHRTLTYSDMRIVSESGNIHADTYWTTRLNNHSSITSLLLANTVTGAASLFRAELLDDLLPFPPRIDQAMHDWWTATTALALGDIGYVAEPLYDYVQHGGNVLGHVAPELQRLSIQEMRAGLRERMPGAAKHTEMLMEARMCFMHHVRRVMLNAKVLELRLGDRIDPPKRAPISRMAAVDESGWGIPWMTARGALRWARLNETVGFDFVLARGLLWRAVGQRLSPRP